jgi:hypothetical protein
MKINPLLAIGIAVVSAGVAAPRLSAGLFSNNIDMVVVAERMDGGHGQPVPGSYLALDGGYIEAGDPIAGDTPPTPAQVALALQSALSNAGFSQDASPSVVLTYHWGVLRVDRRQINVPYGIKSNQQARIELVSTTTLGDEVENHLLLREKGTLLNSTAAAPVLLVGPTETIREESRQPRIFIIVSAYDYQGLLHRDAKLLWRAKLSAREQSGAMDEVIPALIAGGAPYFGKDLQEPSSIEVTPRPIASPAGGAPSLSPDALHLDRQFIGGLLKSERDQFSGGDSGPG